MYMVFFFVKINQWIPSSKKCSCCGNIKSDLTLSDRIYECSCGLKLDRDLNASINILNEGLKFYNTVGTTEINACGNMIQGIESAQEAIIL